MVTIHKISKIILCLIVITSLSFSVFASGEQPSGSSYQYYGIGGTSSTGDYWTASNGNLRTIAYWLRSLASTSFWYFDGDGTASQSDFFTAVSKSLFYIGNAIRNIGSGSSSSSPWTSTQAINVTSDVNDIELNTDSIKTYSSTIMSDTNLIKAKIDTTNSRLLDIMGDVSSIDTNVDLIQSDVQSMKSDVTTLKNNSNTLLSRLGTPSSGSTFWSELVDIYSKISHIDSDFHILNNYVEDLHYMFASPEDIALKQDQENNISSATSNFLSGTSSSTSIGVGDIGNLKTIGTDFASNFDTGVSGTSLFGLIFDNSNDGPFSWFTQDTLDNLSPSSSRGNIRSNSKSSEDVVDFYADKMADLNKLLGEVAKND